MLLATTTLFCKIYKMLYAGDAVRNEKYLIPRAPASLHARRSIAPGGPAVWRDQPARALSEHLAMRPIELRTSEDLKGAYAHIQMTHKGIIMPIVAPANSLLQPSQHRFHLSQTQLEATKVLLSRSHRLGNQLLIPASAPRTDLYHRLRSIKSPCSWN